MAELADALVLGSSVHDVQVQVLLAALCEKERKNAKKALLRSFFNSFMPLLMLFDCVSCIVKSSSGELLSSNSRQKIKKFHTKKQAPGTFQGLAF